MRFVSTIEQLRVRPLIRACQLGDLCWSTRPFGDANETWSSLQRQHKEAAPPARGV